MTKSSTSRKGRKQLKNRGDVCSHVLSVRVTPKEIEEIRKAAKAYNYTTVEFSKNCILAMTKKALSK